MSTSSDLDLGSPKRVAMSAAQVTVGIPTFNRAALLRESIESVLAQTFTNFRLVVSDNASDDETPEVVRSFDDERIDYVRSDRNVGSIENLNRLIGLAETDFLVLLPDDDLLYPGHLEAAIEVLERFETVGLAHSAYDFIDAQSRVTRHMNPQVSRSPVTFQKRDLALERLMVSRWPVCFPSAVYRTKAIVDAEGFRAEEEPFCDLQTWMRIAVDWDFAYIAKPLAGFRVHPDRVTEHVIVESGVSSAADESLVYSRIFFQRRMHFLDDATLDPQTTEWLRALATLEHLAECAGSDLSWGEVAAGLAKLVRSSPRIVLRVRLWRLVVAQLGGRRLRSALRGAAHRPGLAKGG